MLCITDELVKFTTTNIEDPDETPCHVLLYTDFGDARHSQIRPMPFKNRVSGRFKFNEVIITTKIEPVHEISNNVICATSNASDQPAHTRSLIRAFASRLSIL